MAKEDKVRKLREESKRTAQKGLKRPEGMLMPPRKAMRQSKKLSKGKPYPIPPYAGVSLPTLFRWARLQWEDLGRWQRLAIPVAVLVGLRTWEKERHLQEERWLQLEKAEAKRYAAEIYGAFGARKKRRLFGLIPLP